MSQADERVRMKVDGLVFDPLSNTPIIILKDEAGGRSLPIWVGYPEATAIALEMETVVTPRPMTHDLIKNLLDALKATLQHVTVNDLKDNTFYAKLSLQVETGEIEVDSRPSDAIAIALRVGCPIYVRASVLEEAKNNSELNKQGAVQPPEDEEQFKRWLDDIRPSDFGKMDQ
ncbi:MAG: bifunctional nuclease family protein [Nitrospinae bacterium]|nr:bifunctional nuclease family protein [Nitrospinota bacterium]